MAWRAQMNNIRIFLFSCLFITSLFVFLADANAAEFSDGPLIKGYGKHIEVKQDLVLDTNATLKVAFDVSKHADKGKINRKFDSVARFLNMHVANGFAAKNIKLALIIHGTAGFDVLNNKAYQAKYGKNNPNVELLSLLMKNKVNIYVCGQSAAYHKISNADLHTGVQMALSAMTAHAVLQQQGYTLNPF